MSTQTSKLSIPTTSPVESWLTKRQASHILQVAEKTIDRMAKAGELHKEMLRRPGQVPIVVFHPGDVERAKTVRQKTFVMPETGVQRMADLEVSQVSTHMAKLSTPDSSQVSTPTSKLSTVPIQLWLTLQEAIEYSGLPGAILLDFIGSGRLPSLDVGKGRRGGRWRIRKGDLRELRAPQIREQNA